MTATEVEGYLDSHGIKYVKIQHSPAFTAQEIAESAGISGGHLAKTVMVTCSEGFKMVVVPSNYHIVFNELEDLLGLSELDLAEEQSFASLFPNCQLGAIPPLGALYGLDVYMAQKLAEFDDVIFSAGSHDTLIRMSFSDYARLEKPQVFSMGPALSSLTAPRMKSRPRQIFH